MADTGLSKPARLLFSLQRHAARPWFLPSVAIFPICDFALPFLPNQLLLAGLAITLPRRWLALAATFALATGTGAALMVAALQEFGSPLFRLWLGELPNAGVLSAALIQIRAYGLFALVGLAMLPWPPRTAVLACALAGLPALPVGLAVLIGRIVPATLYAAAGAKAPHLLRKLATVDRFIKDIESERRRVDPQQGDEGVLTPLPPPPPSLTAPPATGSGKPV